jgi:hypothetical protein
MSEPLNIANEQSNVNSTPRKKTMSPEALAANRANARKSTGPRSQNGKLKSSVNALRHGVYSEKFIVGTEDENAFRNFAASFMDEFEPQTASELELVDALIQTSWRRRRISALISAHLNQALDEVNLEDSRMNMRNQTQTPPAEPQAPPAPRPRHQSPEGRTIRAYARAERSEPSLPKLESHETRLVSLYLRLLTRLEKVLKLRNEANLRLNPLLFAA